MKKLLSLLLSATLIASMAVSASAEDEIKVYINEDELICEEGVAPFLMNDRTMVPLRAISEGLGYDVAWDEETESITILDGTMLYTMWVGKQCGFGITPIITTSTVMDVVPTVVNDRTYIPLRALTELMPNVDIAYDEATNTVAVTAEPLSEEVAVGSAADYQTYTNAVLEQYSIYEDVLTGKENARVYATITLQDNSKIKLELYPQVAPQTVENFVMLANAHCFDGKIFHRVIDGFVIQGGAFDVEGNQYSTDAINGEFLANGVVNLLSHQPGVISMARTNDPNSGSNQFFIVQGDATFLDGNYASFGKVIEGMEVVDAIAKVATDDNDKPLENVIIRDVELNLGAYAEAYANLLALPVNIKEVSASTTQKSDPTVDDMAQSMQMTYLDFVRECGVDVADAKPDMKFSDFEKIIPLGNYIELFFNCTYQEFIEYYGIPSNKVSRDTLMEDVFKIIEAQQ